MTKKFGVSMVELQKLHQFQFSLMQRRTRAVTNRITTANMQFIGFVQLISENWPTPEIKRVCIDCENFHIDDSLIVIPKKLILKIEQENNRIKLKFKRSIYGIGFALRLGFTNNNLKERFLEALGEVTEEDYDSDISSKGLTPPPLDDSSREVSNSPVENSKTVD